MREYFKAQNINTDDPENLEIFSLATTVSGDLTAKEIYPNVYVVSNALTEKHLEYLNNFCRTATKEDWESYYRERYEIEAINPPSEVHEETKKNEENYWFDRSMTIKDADLCVEINERIRPFFGDRFHLPVINEVHRQKIGEGMDEHADMGPRADLLRSMLFYINDDYEGGELYFPALDLEYKPKAGDFVTFPSYERYTHGVRHVLSGSDRYVLAGFAWKARY